LGLTSAAAAVAAATVGKAAARRQRASDPCGTTAALNTNYEGMPQFSLFFQMMVFERP
jgi:hypothetical protein